MNLGLAVARSLFVSFVCFVVSSAFFGSLRQPVDQRDLRGGEGGEGEPGEPFAPGEANLLRFGEPELELHRAEFDEVAIAQQGLGEGLAVDGRVGVRLAREEEAVGKFQVETEMVFPDAGVFQAQQRGGGTTDGEGKLRAVWELPARLPVRTLSSTIGQKRRGTKIFSPG